MKHQPPGLAKKFLRWFCHAEFIEETEGDLDELFRQRLANQGIFVAWTKYWSDVIHSIRPYSTTPRRNHFSGSKGWRDRPEHFFRMAFRNMARSRTSSLINLTGLAVGLASFLMITLYLIDELTFDSIHKDPDNTYRISYSFVGFDGNEDRDARAAGMWSLKLKEIAPEVKQVVRFSRFGYPGNVWVDNPDNVFVEQQFYWVDSTYIDIFSCPLLTPGDVKSILRDPHSVIISETMAEKYFGSADPVGRPLTYVRDGMDFSLTVGAVMKNYPSNSTVKPDFIANCVALDPLWKRPGNADRINSWGDSFSYSFIQVNPGTDIAKLGEILQNLFSVHLGEFAKTTHPVFVPLRDIHFTTGFLFELESPGDKKHLYIFASIALLVMCMACINYMNLATARSMRRSKEVGLRKTLGAGKGSLIIQFLGESLLMTSIALFLAMILVALFLSSFNELTGKTFTLLSIFHTKTVWLILASSCLVGIVSGSYPAFYLSGFKPVVVLKGTFVPSGGHEQFRKGLVVAQISITILFLTSAYVIHEQLSFIDHTALGKFKDQVVTVRLGDSVMKNRIVNYKQVAQQNPRIGDISVGPHLPRRENFSNLGRSYNFPSLGKAKLNWDQFDADADFASMFGLAFIAGRNLSIQNPADTSAVILNESAVKELGISPEQSLGLESEYITYYHVNNEPVAVVNKSKVIGVVRDFNYESIKKVIRPAVITGKVKDSEMMYIRISDGNFSETLDYLEKTWKRIYPAMPFQYFFMDEEFGRLYQTERQMASIFTWLAAIAILIACLGLFGLASFTAEQRTREIGIRKVLGASAQQILVMLTSGFVKLVLIAFVIGGPLAFFSVRGWMNTFAYKADIGSSIYVAAGVLVLLFTILTVGIESMRAARINPAQSMRHE